MSTLEREKEAGFTRLELLVVCAALAGLALVALPSLAGNRDRSQRLLCDNNLRLAGQAIQQWSTEHGGRLPWRTSWCDGGTMPDTCPAGNPSWSGAGLNNNLWFQWYWMSNELRSPKLLVCPSDTQKRPAQDWQNDPSGGFIHPNLRNGAVSYFIGLDVLPEHREGLLAGDRNLMFDVPNQPCSSRITVTQGLGLSAYRFSIGTGLHEQQGNFLFTDGRVEELSSSGLVKRMREIYGWMDNGTVHYLPPSP